MILSGPGVPLCVAPEKRPQALSSVLVVLQQSAAAEPPVAGPEIEIMPPTLLSVGR